MEWANVSKTKDLEIVRAAVDRLDINERDQRGRTPLMLFITNRMRPGTTERLQTCCSKRKERYV
ncbi:ankyrin repeat domain-containing protein [Brevibacillus brevis]|uniref:ankyrin repeat domain-containing protein n=1 Tax=Brevibacillus brevis TaxID=1393 RepID=UPI0005A0DD44|nr:ankyrin repeat domain-containing protein [Brevibacillus brevis]